MINERKGKTLSKNKIEEAIKTMEHWIEYEKNNKEKINKVDELINIQETILLEYKRILKENEELNNRCKNLDEEAQAYVEELMGDSTLKDRIINRLNKENEELRADNYELNNRKYSNSKDKIEIEEDVKLLKSYLEAMKDVPLGRRCSNFNSNSKFNKRI